MNDNINYEDEIFEDENEQNEDVSEKKEKVNPEKLVRICIAAIIVAVVVVALLVTTVISMRSNEEETTLPADETTTLTEEITTSPAEKYAPGEYTVKVGEKGTLNLRKEPSKDAEQILGIPSGTLLEITEIKYDETAEEDSQYWGRTEYLGWDAWVSMKYLVNAYSDTVVTPGEITTSAEETTSSSDETTASPEQTTAAPEVTTAAPEATTAAPEVTTAAPETTTSASAGSAFSTGTYTVTADPHLNMRENHDVGSLSIAQIPHNSTVTVVDVYYDEDSTNSYTKYWGKVTFGGVTGWIAMGYLE